MQVRLHPHAVWSSLARTDSHGFLAPCKLLQEKDIRSNREAWKSNKLDILHLFRWFTHTPCRSRVGELNMNMKWRWQLECSNPQSSSFSSSLKTCSWLNFRRGHVFDFNVVPLSKQIWPKTWLLNFWAATGVPSLLNESCGTEPGNWTHWEKFAGSLKWNELPQQQRASSNTSL